MNAKELKAKLEGGALQKHADLYRDITAQTARYIKAIDRFTELFGEREDVCLFSVPGRSEISGNHTDHNRGCVLAGAIDRDIIAVAAKTDDGEIRLISEGYPEDRIRLSETSDPASQSDFTSAALIAGMVDGFRKRGLPVGGFVAYTTTEVLKGSGISSSAAFEVMVGNILNHLYGEGRTDNAEIARIAQYSENVWFGKPSGLMDQTACAVGGFVFIDFEDPAAPVIKPIPFSLSDAGYDLMIVNTGGNHADLNADYASIPAEMKAVAAYFGRDVLRGVTESELIANAPLLRRTAGDRALLRALHFVRENDRVLAQAAALEKGDLSAFLDGVNASGRSSFMYLQNVYTNANVTEQGLSLALAVTDGLLSGKGCAFRVHGGGFAGTIQAFVKRELSAGYTEVLDSVFGAGSVMRLSIRPRGAVKIDL